MRRTERKEGREVGRAKEGRQEVAQLGRNRVGGVVRGWPFL